MMDRYLDGTKRLASFVRNILRKIFGATKIDKIWRTIYNWELENLWAPGLFIFYMNK